MNEGTQISLTVQNCSKVCHISQTVRANLPIWAKGIQYFLTKACIDFRVLGEHGYRECCQNSGLGSSSVQFLASWSVNGRTGLRPASKRLNVSSLITL